MLENEGIVEEDDYMYPGCQLRRNTAVGTVTGLEVFLYQTNKSESLGLGQRDKDGARVRRKNIKMQIITIIILSESFNRDSIHGHLLSL